MPARQGPRQTYAFPTIDWSWVLKCYADTGKVAHGISVQHVTKAISQATEIGVEIDIDGLMPIPGSSMVLPFKKPDIDLCNQVIAVGMGDGQTSSIQSSTFREALNIAACIRFTEENPVAFPIQKSQASQLTPAHHNPTGHLFGSVLTLQGQTPVRLFVVAERPLSLDCVSLSPIKMMDENIVLPRYLRLTLNRGDLGLSDPPITPAQVGYRH